MCNRPLRRILVACALFALSPRLIGATFTVDDVTLSIRPSDGSAGEAVLGDRAPIRLDKTIDATQRDNERIVIEIGNINPVLFSYSVSEATLTPTSSAEATVQFVDALSGLYDVIRPRSLNDDQVRQRFARTQPAATRLLIEGTDVVALLDRTSEVLVRLRDAPGEIERSAAANNGTHLDAEIRSWGGAQLLSDLRRHFASADAIRQKVFSGGKISYRINGGPPQTADTLEAIRIALGDSELAARLNGLMWVLTDAPRILEDAAELAALEEAYTRIGTSLQLAHNDYASGSISSRTVTVTANPRFQAFFTDRVRAFQSDRATSVEVIVRPHERIHARVSPAVIVSFVEAPEFAAMQNDQGEIVVVENEDDMTVNAAVSLHLLPDRWYRQNVQPFFEVGVGPTSDEPAVFGGFGVTAGKATVSFGLIYQKVDRLASPLSVGSVLTSVNDLAVDDDWESGAYVSIGLKLGSD